MSQANLIADRPGHYTLKGVLSFQSVPEVLAQHGDLFREPGQQVTIDLHQVQHADSAGVALLVEWMNLARQSQGELTLTNIPAQMFAITRVSGLDHILPLARGQD